MTSPIEIGTDRRKLLLVVGFDAHSRESLASAQSRARASGLRLEICHVQAQAVSLHAERMSSFDMAQTLRSWVEYGGGISVDECSFRVESGDAVDAIVRASHDDAALVVVAQRFEPSRQLSIRRLSQLCPCPVIFTEDMGRERDLAAGLNAPPTEIAPPRRPYKVLLSLSHEHSGSAGYADALRRGFALSKVFGGELYVLEVLRGEPIHRVLTPHLSLSFAISDEAALVEAHRRTWERCVEVAPDLGLHRVLVRSGALLAETARAISEIVPDLVVVQGHPLLHGRDISGLAGSMRVPIFVAKHFEENDTIVAATDLRDPEYPVLREAASLSRRLDAPLVFVHHAELASIPGSAPSHRWVEQLSEAAERMAPRAESVLSEGVSVTDGILAEAQLRRADVVVVGVRRASWRARNHGKSVASTVVEKAQRSVLVTPIGSTS